MTTTVDVYGAYRQVLADEATRPVAQWTFKSNTAYRQILEHVTQAQAEQYIAVMQRDFPDQWRMCRRSLLDAALANDSVGKPERAQFDSLGITCSPTNFRYMWQALAVVRHIRNLWLPVDLVEIGGGYGGLALYLQWLFPHVFASHTIVDLPEAGAIQRSYAADFNFPIRTVDGTDQAAVEAEVTESSLFSAYGFSELDEESRAFYAGR